MFGINLHEFLNGPWEEVRGFLIQELDALQTTLRIKWGAIFDENDTLENIAIDGDATIDTVYVSNEGEDNKPTWARINLQNGVKNRLSLTHVEEGTLKTLLGRGSASDGDYETITLGPGIDIVGTELQVSPGSVIPSFVAQLPRARRGSGEGRRRYFQIGSTAAVSNAIYYRPLTFGTEPLSFVSDGAGTPIMIPFTP